MNRFEQWYTTNSTEITWFVIGMLVGTGIIALAIGNYVSGILNLGIAYINYMWSKL
jgi:hypothetical protein